jgi:hypothetical protein
LFGAGNSIGYVARVDQFLPRFDAIRVIHGAGADAGWGIAHDATTDQICATGVFTGQAHLGSFVLSAAGDFDIWVARLDKNLNVLNAAQMGGAGEDAGFGIAVDKWGYIATTGGFSGTAHFGATTLTSAGSDDVFVSRMWLPGPQRRPIGNVTVPGKDLNVPQVIDDRHWSPDVAINERILEELFAFNNLDAFRADSMLVGDGAVPLPS